MEIVFLREGVREFRLATMVMRNCLLHGTSDSSIEDAATSTEEVSCMLDQSYADSILYNKA
jgi:hypothetical protein